MTSFDILKNFVQIYTAQKMKFSIKDFFSKCDQIRRKLRIWSHLLKKPLMKKLHFLCSGTESLIKAHVFCRQVSAFSSVFSFPSVVPDIP